MEGEGRKSGEGEEGNDCWGWRVAESGGNIKGRSGAGKGRGRKQEATETGELWEKGEISRRWMRQQVLCGAWGRDMEGHDSGYRKRGLNEGRVGVTLPRRKQ